MPQTAVEKLISSRVGRPVAAGDLVIAPVDVVMAQDGNAPLAIRLLDTELGGRRLFDPARVVLVIDHCSPSPNEGASNLQALMRGFTAETGARLFDIGEGISHMVLPEHGYARPGTLVVGSDSHTVTYGALNCLGTGMGATDIAVAMRTGKVWLRVPQTLRLDLHGELRPGVTAKDLTLWLARRLGVDGATYDCLEVDGEGLRGLDIDARFTIANMAMELGAKCVLMPVDAECEAYLARHAEGGWTSVESDPGCRYRDRVAVDLAEVERLVALPHDLTEVTPVTEVGDRPIDIAFIGTCTNGRLSDLARAAEVLRGHRVHPRVRLIVTPGSRAILLEAVRTHVVETLVAAGAVLTTPGCGPCVGTHMGIPGDGEVVISTANRNFRGRMGNRRASIIIASPETVAASAVLGRVGGVAELALAAA